MNLIVTQIGSRRSVEISVVSDVDLIAGIISYKVNTCRLDMYKQKWYADINNSSRLESYCIFKHDFVSEKYLDFIHEKKYRIALARFRTSSHSLNIESGRYENIPRELRLCKSCNMQRVESEFHFLLVCPHFRHLRIKYFKPYFCHWPTIKKFESIMSTTNKKMLCNIAKFIYFADKTRVK